MSKEYDEYLASDEWKETREEIKDKRGRKCEICGSTENLVVHHTKPAYNYLHDEVNHIELMRVLCKKCHDTYHALKDIDEEAKDIDRHNRHEDWEQKVKERELKEQ